MRATTLTLVIMLTLTAGLQAAAPSSEIGDALGASQRILELHRGISRILFPDIDEDVLIPLPVATPAASGQRAAAEPPVMVCGGRDAAKAPTSRASFCSMSRLDFRTLACSAENRLAFANQGGLLDKGICWWHSRFQRKAFYLTVFRPELPKPSPEEAAALIKALARGRRVVEIPGYSAMYDFSRDFKEEIIKRLEIWQRRDGFLRQAWANALRGKHKVHPDELKAMMDELYETLRTGMDFVYQKQAINGIFSHAWLVIDMTPTPDGYALTVLDSNESAPIDVRYREGQTSLEGDFGPFIPYTQKEGEMERIREAQEEYCADPPHAFVSVKTDYSKVGASSRVRAGSRNL